MKINSYQTRTYDHFDDVININDLDSRNMKIMIMYSKCNLIYFIGYKASNDLKNIFNERNGYFEVNNERKYLTLILIDENKDVLKKQ